MGRVELMGVVGVGAMVLAVSGAALALVSAADAPLPEP